MFTHLSSHLAHVKYVPYAGTGPFPFPFVTNAVKQAVYILHVFAGKSSAVVEL